MGHGAADLKYRFQWNFPIFFSPHDPNTLYAAGNVLFKTTDEGQTWTADQPRPDAQRQVQARPVRRTDHQGQHVGRVLLHDLRGARVAAREGRALVRLATTAWCTSRATAARHWKKVTPPDLPEWSHDQQHRGPPDREGRPLRRRDALQARRLPPLPLQDDRLRQDLDEDRRPASRTTTSPASSAPTRSGPACSTPAPRAACTSRSTTARNWQPFQLNLPIVPITDLAIKNDDLIVATQGRSFWVLDDLTPLHQLKPES